jgi:hypothetical protein
MYRFESLCYMLNVVDQLSWSGGGENSGESRLQPASRSGGMLGATNIWWNLVGGGGNEILSRQLQSIMVGSQSLIMDSQQDWWVRDS